MEVLKSKLEDISNLMDLFNSCVVDMREKGIYQWNNLYPNLEIVRSDICKEEAYSIGSKDCKVATITLNEEQSPEYKAIPWIGLEPVLVIHRLAVHPNFQNQGFGKIIMEFAQAYAKSNGYSCIRMDAFTKNPLALSLYNKLGYEKRGEVYFPGRAIPFYCLEKLFNKRLSS